MSRVELVIILGVVNLIQFYFIMSLLKKNGEYEDALKKIGGITSSFKKEKPTPPPPDPRKPLEWKIKR